MDDFMNGLDFKIDTSPLYEQLEALYQQPIPMSSIPTSGIPEFDMRPKWHQLVVVGNGFDRECGLPSSFPDFMEARRELLSGGNDAEEGPGGEDRETVWDVILRDEDGENWCDIEEAIARWVDPPAADAEPGPRSAIEWCLEGLRHGAAWNSSDEDARRKGMEVAKHLEGRFGPTCSGWTVDDLVDISLNDLSVIESCFSRYLEDAISKTLGYKDKASELMIDILGWHRPDGNEYDAEDSILSFNYTRAVKSYRSEEHEASYVNIHGRLGGEIVFGIDGTNRMDNAVRRRFGTEAFALRTTI